MRNLAHAIRPLANDLFSSILFAVLIALKVEPRIASMVAIATGVGHVLLWFVLRKPIARLQWASLALVLTLGLAGVLTNDPRFLMVKPTIVYFIIAAVMLERGWMLRYMPPIARGHGEPMMILFGYVWAGLMAATGVANLAIAVVWPQHWPMFLATVPTSSKLILFAVQFLTVRAYVKPRVMAERAAAAAEAA